MAKNACMKVKAADGTVVIVGDVGHTRIRKPPVDMDNPDAYEVGFLYAFTPKNTGDIPQVSGYIGEINDIQIDPDARPTAESVKAGQTIVYSEGDLL